MLKTCTYLFLILLLTASGKGDAKKGNEAYENEDYARAESFYRTAIEADPERYEVVFNLANTLAKQGKTEEAIQSYLQFKSLTEDANQKSSAEYNIGTLLAESEEWKAASEHLKKALMLNPADEEARQNLEKVLAELDKQENEDQHDQQQENQPPDPPTVYAKAMKKRAEELVGEKKYREAYNLMQNALKVDPTVSNFNTFINRIGEVDEIDS